MIHPLNQPIAIPAETLEWANKNRNKKNEGQAFGVAVDDFFKHCAMRKLQCTIPPKFAPYDLQMGDLKAEVKSTAKKSFTFSKKEYDFIHEQYQLEKQYKILFYVNDLEACTTTYIGALNVSVIFESKLFKDSIKTSDGYVIFLDDIKSFLAS